MDNSLRYIMRLIQLKLVGENLELTIFANQLEFSYQRIKVIFTSREELKKLSYLPHQKIAAQFMLLE